MKEPKAAADFIKFVTAPAAAAAYKAKAWSPRRDKTCCNFGPNCEGS